MKPLVAVSAIAACCLSFAAPHKADAAAFGVDSGHSSVIFRIKHLNTSYTWGRFNAISGTIDLDAASPVIDVQVTVDSIDTADAKRDGHLKGPDFFNAKQFPTIAFKGNKVTRIGDNTYDVEGTLTLHGVDKPITVRIERSGPNPSLMGGKILGVDTTFKIKRSDFGMKFMAGPIGDEVLLHVSLECAAK